METSVSNGICAARTTNMAGRQRVGGRRGRGEREREREREKEEGRKRNTWRKEASKRRRDSHTTHHMLNLRLHLNTPGGWEVTY